VKGRFFALEGPDGAGKTTLLAAARAHFEARGLTVTTVRDPGGTAVGDAIRRILLDPEQESMTPLSELLLYLAARAQMVAELVRPALATGGIVLADRFSLSTLAYQGAAKAMPEKELARLVSRLAGVSPDHVILLDLPPEAGLARLKRAKDRMESRGLPFLREVRRRYRCAARALGRRATVIDAARPLVEVRADVLAALDRRLPPRP